MKLDNVTAAWLALTSADIDARIIEHAFTPRKNISINFKNEDRTYYRIVFCFDMSTAECQLDEIYWHGSQRQVSHYFACKDWHMNKVPPPELKNMIDIVFKELGIV